MKRRFGALLCAAAICLGLFLPVRAAEDICFTAVNERVLTLSDDSMPVWSGGILYVPWYVFDSGTVGLSLGTSCAYSKSGSIVTVYSLRKMLVFDLNAGTCHNHYTGDRLTGKAIIRNGIPYLPADRVALFFGMKPTAYLRTDYGYLVRLKNSDATLSDEEFVVAATNVLENRLKDYEQGKAQPPEEAPCPSTPPTQTTPEPSNIPTYVAVRCDTLEHTQEIAECLEQYDDLALFFIPAEEVGRQGPLIRRLLGSGHSVGILAQGETLAQTQQLLELGAQALATVARTRTYFALVPDQQREALEQEGWVCWQDAVSAVPDGSLTAYNHAARVVRALPDKDAARLTLDDSRLCWDAAPYLLRQLRSGQYTVTIPRETQL